MFPLDTLDIWCAASAPIVLLSLYYFTQGLYSLSFLVDGYLFSRPVNMIDMGEKADLVEGSKKDYPAIVLFYPVLEEQEPIIGRGSPSGTLGTTTPRRIGGIKAKMPTTRICHPRKPAN